MRPGRLLLGVVTGPHGVKGQVRLKSFTAEPADIAAYGPLATADGRRFTVAVTGRAKGVVLARLSGIDDRTAAEALKGTELWLERDSLPAPEDDETFYHADLIGLAVEDTGGRALGAVTAVHDFGAGDVLEIKGAAGELMVPFTRAAVPTVDLAGGRLVVDPPEEELAEEELAEKLAEDGA
ncbi:ribosome maturation factor RimM [Roseospirillum parvum]|uniref:Ribosome maturation factor RimM n=1 Tax=Roseospirillum parvum TaxID=83401 RepID=A0A1G7TPD1_9PROT|nr:ribosome maturation factor RimM [Roseospirillum parvum]SDG36330.1 16S rRNA processing protein RimM [Roseospirillum parvum]